MESIITNGTSVLGAVELGARPGLLTRGMLAAREAPARDVAIRRASFPATAFDIDRASPGFSSIGKGGEPRRYEGRPT